ncbi:ABC transporter permease [bacterium SCSIO 12643]|nr:ABC transporter permease [bacterium SCSIO 12643]
MEIYIKLFLESISFSLTALSTNKLRTTLSLLGITIGIFSIITVFTLVDSLELKIRNSVEDLGDNVIFVQKWPWKFGGAYNWWDYMARPYPSPEEQVAIAKDSKYAAGSAYTCNFSRTVQFSRNSVESTIIIGASKGYDLVRNFEVENGRYFTEKELRSGANVCVIGNQIAFDLFGYTPAVGKTIKIGGRKAKVIGVFKREGESMIGFSLDPYVVLPLNYARTMVNVKSRRVDPTIYVKAKEGINNAALKDELTGIMRAERRLKPRAQNDFALNEISIISEGFDGFFGFINWLGGIIGGFSILVGAVSIANIMFVSVRERTRIIGIQKALGAKNGFILFQFLSESVILSLIGGIFGLILISILSVSVNLFTEYEVVMTSGNIILGISISVIIGIIAGVFPAWQAAKKDPVEAIRS